MRSLGYPSLIGGDAEFALDGNDDLLPEAETSLMVMLSDVDAWEASAGLGVSRNAVSAKQGDRAQP